MGCYINRMRVEGKRYLRQPLIVGRMEIDSLTPTDTHLGRRQTAIMIEKVRT
jgi:hypothetical protein